MPHTECAHRQAQMQISNDTLSPRAVHCFWSGPWGICVKSYALHKEQGFMWDAAYTDTSLHYRRGLLLHITISIHSMEFSLGMSTAAHFLSLSLSVLPRPVCPSLQVSVFKVPILKGEPFLFSLAPFLIVKVNVSALEEQQSRRNNHINKSVKSNLSFNWR